MLLINPSNTELIEVCGGSMKNELERVRDWAKGEIQSRSVPAWSWDQYVKLIEAADAILHDMSVTANYSKSAQRRGRHFRIVAAEDQRGRIAHSR